MATEFIVLCGQVVGSGPFVVEYGFDGERFEVRKEAIRHGFKARGSGDFNIGVLEAGQLVSLDWMEKPVDTDMGLMAEIANQIGL